ncbi:hypothetical protein LLH23_08385 [bacterium]|nr:hypothetical protein [bacterium]
MICPKCHQPVQVTAGDCCPLCGFRLRPYRQRLQTIYTLGFAFFASTLIYSILVYFLDTRGVVRPLALPPVVPYVALVVAVLNLGLARRVGPPLEQLKTMAQLQQVFLVRMALVEAAAVLGVVIYVLTASLPWFVTFLAISWVGLLVVGSQMPHLGQRLAELAVEETSSRGDQ